MEVENLSLIETFSPDDYLVNILRRAVANDQTILVETEDKGSILVIPSENRFYSQTSTLDAFCNLPQKQYKVSVLNDTSKQQFSADQGKSLDELLWLAGYYASSGKLIDDCSWNSVVELSYWPNFTRLPMQPSFLRMASLLAKRPTSVEYCISKLKVKREEAYQFFSAAYCAKSLRISNKPGIEEQLKPHRNQALLSLLLQKIGQF